MVIIHVGQSEKACFGRRGTDHPTGHRERVDKGLDGVPFFDS